MKKKGISIFIILLLSSLPFSPTLMAQEKKLTTTEEAPVPFYQGTAIGVDVFGIGSKLFGSSSTSTEVNIEVNLKNRFIPVVEIGYGEMNTTDDGTNIYYKAAAPYFRVGMNYNAMYKKPYLPGYLFVGFRLAHTSFSYDVVAPNMVDPTWGNVEVPFSYYGVKTNVTWMEFLVGIKTKVYKNFCMGWTFRYRSRLSMKKAENTEPTYIPGYGKNKSSIFGGITYSLIYNLPF